MINKTGLPEGVAKIPDELREGLPEGVAKIPDELREVDDDGAGVDGGGDGRDATELGYGGTAGSPIKWRIEVQQLVDPRKRRDYLLLGFTERLEGGKRDPVLG
ncbi:hypothetical protein NE237_018513 [Protea cynaroides]|uniref:Uncharacterized protein n=1 Tax=Protea cynaroides TaxID=273540 RepID=A0A9Q0KA42_9MAGN|nr:hypothetical protein NE237_018513 [Protea cynaroides]